MIQNVIKRDGSRQPFDEAKLNRWASYAARNGIEWSDLARETFIKLPDECSTETIHTTMINVCLAKEDITYSRFAARLLIATLRKNMIKHVGCSDKDSFKDIHKAMVLKGLWTIEYDEALEDIYNDLYPYKFEYWQIKQWMDKYSAKVDDVPVETPHMGLLALAKGTFSEPSKIRTYAKNLVEGSINLPTPVLNGVRNGDFDSISCCVISGGDSVDSIGVAEHIAYKMTAKKAGIGIEVTTRSKGAPVKGGRVKHLGKSPIYHAIDKSVKMFTQISRGGSATVTYNCIDPEIENLLLLKTQKIDEKQRIDKLDYSFAYCDAFVEAVVGNKDWYLFDYLLNPNGHQMIYNPRATYEDFERLATAYGNVKSIKARDLLKLFLTSRQETGRVYCINLSRANSHTPFEDTIRLSNLCVAPETQILTDKGYQVIQDLEEQVVNVWNGQEFSRTTVHKTGTNQELLKVTTDSGQTLECTPYHKFYVATDYKGSTVVKRAHELNPGDKLIKFDLPIIQGNKVLPKAYQNGFYSADGCNVQGKARIYLYGAKKNLEPLFDLSNVSRDVKQDRVYGIEVDLKDKFFVPSSDYTIQSRLNWLAGFMDGDGCIYRNGNNEQLVASSVEPEFLKELQLMLQTLGVESKVQLMSEAGVKMLPKNDGSGETGAYNCKESYRIIINSNGLFKLHQLGIQFHRLQTTKRLPQRSASHFIKVTSVVDEGRVDDTYCFTESKRGMGMFAGMLTGQCQEIMLPTKPYDGMHDLYTNTHSQGETAFCSLGAINPLKIKNIDHYQEIADILVEAINIYIDKAPMMTASMKNSIMNRRSIGVGITGLAGWLYAQNLDYDMSIRAKQAVGELAEMHYYCLLRASQNLYKGTTPEGIDLNWLPIDTKVNDWYTPKLDWESLRGKPRVNSVLVAHMPTESSAVFSNATNGLYPVRQKVINKQSRYGNIQYIAPPGSYKLAWDIENNHLADIYSIIQDFTDQAISADYYVDFTKYEGGKVGLKQLMQEWVYQARKGNKTMYYVNSNDDNGGMFSADADGCSSCKL